MRYPSTTRILLLSAAENRYGQTLSFDKNHNLMTMSNARQKKTGILNIIAENLELAC